MKKDCGAKPLERERNGLLVGGRATEMVVESWLTPENQRERDGSERPVAGTEPQN